MKKILAIFLCIGFVLCASGFIYAQEKPIKRSPADTTGIKSKMPKKQIHKQKEQIKKAESQYPKIPRIYEDRPLLMKEKDSLQNKTK